jgi:hypothetical protein
LPVYTCCSAQMHTSRTCGTQIWPRGVIVKADRTTGFSSFRRVNRRRCVDRPGPGQERMQGSEGDFHCMGMIAARIGKATGQQGKRAVQYCMSPRAIIEHIGLLEIQAVAFEKSSMTLASNWSPISGLRPSCPAKTCFEGSVRHSDAIKRRGSDYQIDQKLPWVQTQIDISDAAVRPCSPFWWLGTSIVTSAERVRACFFEEKSPPRTRSVSTFLCSSLSVTH